MSAQPKKLGVGLGLLAAFAVVLVLIFMPLFPGLEQGKKENGLNYLDNLYNTISKGSAYYIPEVQAKAKELQGQQLDLAISFGDVKLAEKDKPAYTYPGADQAKSVARILNAAGAQATAEGNQVKIKGAVDKVLLACLTDCEDLYNNNDKAVSARYEGSPPAKSVMFNWHSTLILMGKELNRLGNREGGDTGRQKFAQAKVADAIKVKAVETAFNYSGIQPKKIGQEWMIVLFSLVFYVVYTVWYGYSIMYIFEGIGMNLEH